MVETMEMEKPLSLGLKCAAWQMLLWRPWGGCSMSESLRQEGEDHLIEIQEEFMMKNPEARILV
jgi:hypothetical protein